MKAILTFILTICMLLVPAPLSHAEGPCVKLGFILPDSALKNAHVIGQYYTTYLDELSKQTDWGYQLVNIKSADAFDKLFNGDIDLLLSVEYPSSLGLRSDIRYSSMDFGYDVEGFYVRSDDDRFDAQDLNSLQGARVGLIRFRPANEKFEQFQQDNQLTFQIQEFDNQQEMIAALQQGSIDLAVDTATNATSEERFLLAYARIPVRVVSTYKGQERLQEMEVAMKRLFAENPHFEPDLSQVLAENLDFQLIHFTPEETRFIKKMPPLRVAFYGGVKPYITFDDAHGTATGIYADLLDALSRNSGLQFHYVHAPDYDAAIEMLKNGEADIMLDIFAGSLEHLPFYYTNPLLYVTYTFIGNFERTPATDEDIHLILPRPVPSLLAYLHQRFPHWKFQTSAPNASDAISRVHTGQGDLALVSNTSLEIDRPLILYPDLTIIPDASINVPTSLVISPSQPRILQGILNKAITKINPEKRTHIIQKHTIATKPAFSLQHIITFYPLQTGLLCGLILLIFAVWVFRIHHKTKMGKAKKLLQEKNASLNATVKELKQANDSKELYREMAETDALTGVLNKAAIETHGAEILAATPAEGRRHALLIIDLDHFKEANDTLGHQRGDDILRRFALCLIHIVRATDAVGRFGGDEFILVLNNVVPDSIETIASRIMTAAHNLEEPSPGQPRLSASIGVALCPDHGCDYQELLHMADQALYQVKNNGRDGWQMAKR